MKEILIFPDPRLRKIAKELSNVDGKLINLIDEMFETMYHAPGIGLAATQVDIHQRFAVIDISDDKKSPLVLINPEIIEGHGEYEMDEGCLSVPGFYERVKRFGQIHVRAIDRDGNPFEMEADGLLGVCIQHELDHLNGKLFVDHISSLKRQRIKKKLEKELKKMQKG